MIFLKSSICHIQFKSTCTISHALIAETVLQQTPNSHSFTPVMSSTSDINRKPSIKSCDNLLEKTCQNECCVNREKERSEKTGIFHLMPFICKDCSSHSNKGRKTCNEKSIIPILIYDVHLALAVNELKMQTFDSAIYPLPIFTLIAWGSLYFVRKF